MSLPSFSFVYEHCRGDLLCHRQCTLSFFTMVHLSVSPYTCTFVQRFGCFPIYRCLLSTTTRYIAIIPATPFVLSYARLPATCSYTLPNLSCFLIKFS